MNCRSLRKIQGLPIFLIGSDLTGKIFSESTNTVLLSLHGAGLISRHKLSPEQELVLRWPERNKETNIRVVGQIGEDSGVYTYGVAFSDQVVNFGEQEFPPPSPLERELGRLTLVCSVCQAVERIDGTSPEADVCTTNDGVLRYCKRCGSSTIWKVGQPGAVSSPSPRPTPTPPAAPAPSNLPAGQPSSMSASAYSAMAPTDLIIGGLPGPTAPTSFTSSFRPARTPEPAQTSSPPATTSVLTLPAASEKSGKKPAGKSGDPRVNRRKYPRIKVNYIALVRHPERGEEFVQCEDVSRGGLRFKSTSRYLEQTRIEVAAPYSSGQPAIFVPARIVYVQELPEQNLFRYGAQSLNTDRSSSTP